MEGELNSQDQAPLDIKNLGNPPPTRPDINAEETAGATSEGTGPGARAPEQKVHKIIEKENPSPPQSLCSLDDKVTYQSLVNDAGDSGILYSLNSEEGEDEIHSRAPDELSQVTKRSLTSTSEIDKIKKRNVSQSVSVNNNQLKSYEMSESMNLMKKDISNFQTEVVSLKSENYERKKESDENKSEISEIKREMSKIKKEYMYSEIKNENSALKSENSALKGENSALEKENFALKTKMSNLEQAHRNDPIVHFYRNDIPSFQDVLLSPKAGMKASYFEDDDMVHDGTVGYTGGIDIPKEYNDQSDEEYYDACENVIKFES